MLHVSKSSFPGAGEMAQHLGALVPLPEDPDLAHRSYMVAHRIL